MRKTRARQLAKLAEHLATKESGYEAGEQRTSIGKKTHTHTRWAKGSAEQIYRRLKKLPRTLHLAKGFDYGLDYSRCERCPGTCCNIKGEEGYVWITEEEILRVSQYLGHAPEVIERKRGFSLRTYPKKGCHYLRDGKCSIYPVRPSQCRTFPFWSHLKNKDIRHCPGIVRI